MNDIIDIKVFMDTDRDLIKKWKIERDVNERGHSMEKVIQQIDSRKSDYYKYIDSQKENADIVIRFYEDTLQLKCRVFIKNTKIIHKIVCELLHYDIHYMENGNIFFDLNGINDHETYFQEIVRIFMLQIQS